MLGTLKYPRFPSSGMLRYDDKIGKQKTKNKKYNIYKKKKKEYQSTVFISLRRQKNAGIGEGARNVNSK